MPIATVDLATGTFWLAALVGVAILGWRAGGQNRSIAFATINLGFIGLFAGPAVVAAAVAICVCAWTWARLLHRSGPVAWTVVPAILLPLALFIGYKLPAASAALAPTQINPILVALSFSYIMLRLFDMHRAVWERRLRVPTLVDTINFLLPFHMLAAGPIQSYEDFVQQPGEPRRVDRNEVLSALGRIAFGAFKKFVVATALKETFLTDFSVGGWYWFLEVQICFLWLYIDFSAYSDIAVGVGRLLGVHTPENFNKPYLARNLVVFWERWHISLSLWIRRNIFTPVQLAMLRRTAGRRPLLCASLAFSIAFFLCGLWHGVDMRFAAWGALHAFGLVVATNYRAFLARRLGAAGLKRYMANRWIEAAAVALTFEWAAFANMVVFI